MSVVHVRRALDTGAHLESMLPRVAHRQWTLSLPMSVRFLVLTQTQSRPPLAFALHRTSEGAEAFELPARPGAVEGRSPPKDPPKVDPVGSPEAAYRGTCSPTSKGPRRRFGR